MKIKWSKLLKVLSDALALVSGKLQSVGRKQDDADPRP